MTARRITSLHLPFFAIERWERWHQQQGDAPPDDLPVVLTVEGPHGPVIHAANRAARENGIRLGARVVDMRAICPDLQAEYADPSGDIVALERLMLWARRWCPWTAVDGVDGLVLDTTGSDHLWGGEAAMLRDIEARLSLLGFTSTAAIAPTWGAAWGLARFGPVRAICPEGAVAGQLAPLPSAALRLEGETLLLLHRLGLKTVGDLAKIPRLSLTRRFARAELQANPLMRLDQAMGRLAEPVSAPDAPPVFRAIARLAEPILDPAPHLPALCDDLCQQLFKAGQGCRQLHLTAFHTDGELSHLSVATSAPSRDPAHLERLFGDRLERLNPGFGFDLVTLTAGAVEPVREVQAGLEGRDQDDLALPQLVDRLSSRFGAQAVTEPAPVESHMPERAETQERVLQRAAPDPRGGEKRPPVGAGRALPGGAAGHNMHGGRAPRPQRLLEPPEEVRVLYQVPEGPPAQFVWRRQTHRVARYAGPERIAPEWWRDRPGTRLRDYFRIEDQAGRRYWLYREGLPDDGRGGAPRWFLHGVFA